MADVQAAGEAGTLCGGRKGVGAPRPDEILTPRNAEGPIAGRRNGSARAGFGTELAHDAAAVVHRQRAVAVAALRPSSSDGTPPRIVCISYAEDLYEGGLLCRGLLDDEIGVLLLSMAMASTIALQAARAASTIGSCSSSSTRLRYGCRL